MTGNTLIDEGTARAQMRREQLTRSRAHGEVRKLDGWYNGWNADTFERELRMHECQVHDGPAAAFVFGGA